MRIVVLDIAASKTGALTILRDFYDYIRSNPGNNEWIFITGTEDALPETGPSCDGKNAGSDDPCGEGNPGGSIRVICRPDVKASSKNRLRFDLLTGAAYIKSFKPDVLFSLQNTLPRGIKGVKKVLYVHQPLGYQKIRRFSFLKKEERHLAAYQYLYSILVNSSVKASDQTIVQTDWMREAVRKKTGKKEIVKITPDVADISVYGEYAEFDKRSFFYPAGDLLYKNHAVIEEAAGILNSNGIGDFELIFTNRKPMTRPEVCSLYFKSTLIFASYIETFGLPLAEAMQTGNPILAAYTPFAREILSDYENAYYFDPFDAVGLSELMKKVLDGTIAPKKGRQVSPGKSSYSKIVRLLTRQGG